VNSTQPAPVWHGTAEQLARIAHFRGLERTQPEEFDALAYFLLGDVGDAFTREALWANLEPDLLKLWHLVTSDWEEDDLDEVPEADWVRYSFATVAQETDHRYQITRDRLTHEIEHLIHLSRLAAVEARRANRSVA
jgi:hypothetical protein